jgi:hypothetical protein
MIPQDAARWQRVCRPAGTPSTHGSGSVTCKTSSPRPPSTLPTVHSSVRCRMWWGHTRNRWQHGLSCPRLSVGRSAAVEIHFDPAAAIADCDLPVGWRKVTPSNTHASFLFVRQYHQAGRADFHHFSPSASPQAKRMPSQMARLSRTSRATGEKFQESPRQKSNIAVGRTYARGRACNCGDKLLSCR